MTKDYKDKGNDTHSLILRALTQVRQEAYEKGYADGYMSGNEAVTEACQEERARVCEEISDYVKREMPSDFNAVMLINHVTHIQEGLKNNK